ncbi:MAG: beta-N-acetylhexosaminidase [Bdellovibrionaceae bacterium]|nr:beta-N-acetylhexosaminidase [Bdellovibrionales bacterium]MCB9253124.1 beta-N-acetylhexosaminidase [Pseudobdellovibrionaceae bacterium]
MASIKEVKKLVGQLFVVGFDGYSVSNEFAQFIKSYNLGGVIYFKKNVQSPGQLAELSNELQFTYRQPDAPPMFISIDHEGGKVNRLVKPFTKFPGNDHLGELGSPKIGYDFGAILAKELKAVGVNVNFAPVVDVYTNSENTVIKSRSFSSDPEVCAKLGSAVARGIQRNGVMAVAKHFPGHGDVKEDSHFKLPRCDKSVEELEACEWIPFRRAIRGRIDGVMTAHILNKALDAEFPATLSEKTIQTYLRDLMRFNRVIFSDDMEMKAIAAEYTVEQAAVLAVNAGCDCLIYKGTKIPVEAVEAVIKAVEEKAIPLSKIQESVKRIESAKRLYCDVRRPVDVTKVSQQIGLPDHFKLADIITKKEIPDSYTSSANV